VLKVGYEIFVI